MTILVLILSMVLLALSAANVLGVRANKKYKAELEANPPFVKCPVCDLTILGNDKVSQEVHVLCIIKTHDQIEADKKAKEIEAAKPKTDPNTSGRFKITISQNTSKKTPTNSNEWAWDSGARTWYRSSWAVQDANGYVIDSGYTRYDYQAKEIAKAVARRHREGTKEIIV